MGGGSILGMGLNSQDVLRVVGYGVDCTSNSNNPAPINSLKIGCPSVEGAGCITGKEGTDMCPQLDGEGCRTASAADARLAPHGSYLKLQTLGKEQITPEVGIRELIPGESKDGYTIIKFNTVVQYTDLQDGDTIVIDKRDLIFVDMADNVFPLDNWISNPRMREAANVFTNNWHFEDDSNPSSVGRSFLLLPIGEGF